MSPEYSPCRPPVRCGSAVKCGPVQCGPVRCGPAWSRLQLNSEQFPEGCSFKITVNNRSILKYVLRNFSAGSQPRAPEMNSSSHY